MAKIAKSKGPVRMDMTGDEFKKLIEQKDTNGLVDTLQEVLAMFDGIGDNETIAEYIKRVAVTPETMPLNCIGTEQIKEKSIQLDDLSDEVTEKLNDVYDDSDEALYINGSRPEETEETEETEE